MGERNNVALTGAFSNALQTKLEPFLHADATVADPVQHEQQLKDLHASVLQYTGRLSLLADDSLRGVLSGARAYGIA